MACDGVENGCAGVLECWRNGVVEWWGENSPKHAFALAPQNRAAIFFPKTAVYGNLSAKCEPVACLCL